MQAVNCKFSKPKIVDLRTFERAFHILLIYKKVSHTLIITKLLHKSGEWLDPPSHCGCLFIHLSELGGQSCGVGKNVT